MQQLAAQNKLVALDSLVDMSKLQSDYAKTWLDLGSFNGKLYAIFYKAANKGTVWYSPKTFQSAGYTIPKTFDDMVSLSSRIASQRQVPLVHGRLQRRGQRLARHRLDCRDFAQPVRPRRLRPVGRPQDSLDRLEDQERLPGVRPHRLRQALHQRRAAVHPRHRSPARQLSAVQVAARRVHVLPRRLRRRLHHQSVQEHPAGDRLRLLPLPHHQPTVPGRRHHRRGPRRRHEEQQRRARPRPLPRHGSSSGRSGSSAAASPPSTSRSP